MLVKDIPRIIFEEFSLSLGIGNERRLSSGSGYTTYRAMELRDEVGAIGLQETDEQGILVVWNYLPEDLDSVFLQEELCIVAGANNTGSWAYGKGQKQMDTARARFESLGGLYLHKLVAVIVAQVLARAVELIQSPDCDKPVYWQKDKHPEGSYTSP